MVTAGRALRWTRRLLGAFGQDWRGFLAALRGQRGVRPGLHTYHVAQPGRKRRFHLRVAADGSALLLIDVTDAIHLNPSAALLVHLALQGVSADRAAAVLRRRFRQVGVGESRSEAKKIYALVERLTAAAGPCAVSGLGELQWSPLFSVPVSAPYKADLALSYGCNNACAHCYNENRGRSRLATRRETNDEPASEPSACDPPSSCDAPLSLAQWRQVLARLSAVGVPHVIFTGGEPTLFDGLTDLIRAAVGLGLVTGLNTNGRQLADHRFAASLHAAGLDHVQITLESHRPAVHNLMTGADSFPQTRRGIENALASGLHTITNATLTRQNVGHAREIVEFLHSLGLHTFAMNGMIHAGGGRASGDAVPIESLAPVLAGVRDAAKALGMRFLWYTPTQYCRFSPVEWELGPRRCNAGEYSICIEPNGDVLPCQSYYEPAGNLLRDPWERIWHSALFLGFRRRVVDPRGGGLPRRCWSCPDLPLCAGGCRLERQKDEVECSASCVGS